VKTRAATYFPVLLMAALAGVTLWLDRIVQLAEPATPSAQRHDPDFKVEGFTITRMSPEGKPVSVLAARKMIHFPDDQTTELDEPRFEQRPPDAPRVQVRADRGTVSRDGEQVTVRDNVVVVRDGGGERDPLRVETSRLVILPKEEIVRTDAPVTITEGGSRLEGKGLEVRSQDRELRLDSQVKAQFAPGVKVKK
jgi:lipopolysaccharide export system protein LptC